MTVVGQPYRVFQRNFSWKSRLNRDPEMRQRKLEILNKRYLLRRLDALEDVDVVVPSDSVVNRCKDLVEKKMASVSDRVCKQANISSIDGEELRVLNVGSGMTLKEWTLSISQPSPRSAIIVVKDRGNTERLFKHLKRAFPNMFVTLMDRERVELRLPQITNDLREKRGEVVDKLISDSRKELKKLELQTYDELKRMSLADRQLHDARERTRSVFQAAEENLNTVLKTAMDDLGIDFR